MKKIVKHRKEIKSLFLGPKAENQELYESLIMEIIKDSCFLRKNFHPNDLPLITETDKLSDDFQLTSAELKQELQNILAELKQGVPLYHPRYIGHMHGDLLISAIAAYFGTMLYNSNNIVGESSPATTRMEVEYISRLARMVGYKPMINVDNSTEQSWGHLAADGTTANIEALWVARNIKYYPIAVKIASMNEPDCKFIADIHENFYNKKIKDISFSDLFNLPPIIILKLKDFIYKRCQDEGLDVALIKKLIGKYEVFNLGVYGIHQKVSELTGGKETLKLPKLYFAKSYHYSWKKAIDLIGIGHNQIVNVPIDKGFRLDFDSFKKIYDNKTPTLAVIGILGSSKQGSIDPIDDLVEFRNDLEQREKKSFYLHIDGAYGGYFPCILREEDYGLVTADEFINSLKLQNPEDNLPFEINKKWYKKVKAVEFSDSITIDPHKMGYIPYPAGSIIFSDTRCKDFISYLPSYLNKPTDSKDISEEFLGQWTLEGSRPGAAAAACYLSAKVLPYHKDAHGILLRNTIQTAMLFWISLHRFNNPKLNHGFKIVPTYIPETNIVSYVLSCKKVISKTKYLNILTNKLYEAFSIKGDSIIPAQNFMVAKESFAYDDMPKGDFLTQCGIDPKDNENTKEEITILSSVFMNPLSKYLADDFYDAFFKEMVTNAESILSLIMLQIITDKNKGERLKILWIENEDEVNIMKQILLYQSEIGKYLNIYFTTNYQEAEKLIKTEFDCIILDLNLKDKNHEICDQSKIKSAIKLMESVDKEKHMRTLFYSAYLSNKDFKSQIVTELEKIMVLEAYQIIPKSELPTTNKERNSQDMKKIIKGIFEILDKR